MININDSHINPELTFKRLVYLNMQQLTNFPYIEKDFDALTDYELLCLVVKFLNEVIENSNDQNDSITNLYNAFLALQDYMNNSVQELEDAWNDKTNELEEEWQEKTTELETAFNNLQNWIDNYFDNLDVQEEINNKLDQMLEDGVLEQIIEQFIQSTALWCFDTVADMKLATNFTNGSYAKTLGYYSKNDGGYSTYKIRTKTVDDVIDERFLISLYNENLVAELIPVNQEVNFSQLGLQNNVYLDEDFSIANYNFNLLGNTFTAKSYTFTNCKVMNGTIISNTAWSLPMYGNITLENVSIINNNTTGDTSNNMMETTFDNDNDKVIIRNCTFKNYGFHFDECKSVEIKDNLFYATLDNSASIVGSKEFIHVTNSQLVLENCIIEGNVFKDSNNDCIDIYPTGNNTVIKNNTFYRCLKCLELKAENRDPSASDRTVEPIHSCLVQGNYFRELPNNSNATCITIYCNDDTQQDDYTLYPHIIIDSCFFCNDGGYTNPRPIRLQHVNNIQISNCRSNHRGSNAVNYFLYVIASNFTMTNCIIDGDIMNNEEDSIGYISNCQIRTIRKLKRLVINNSQVDRFYFPNTLTNVYYSMDNVICPNNNFTFTGGLFQLSNCKFHSILNSYTEDATKTDVDYAAIVNCFYDTGTLGTNNANFNAINCNKINSSANLYISNLN